LGSPEAVYGATWPPLVDEATFYAVQARLLDPARSTRRPGRAKHVLSLIATCDVCGSGLSAAWPKDVRDGGRRYTCREGHVTIAADRLDGWAEEQILGLLTRPDVLARLLPTGADPDALKAARDEVARIRAEHRALIRQVADGRLSAAMAAGAEPGILRRLATAEQRVAELTAPAALAHLVQPGDVAAQWEAMPVAAKREVVKLLFAPGVLGVLSLVRGRRQSVERRVRLDGKPLADNPSPM
jgi:hypothetical protein